MGDARQCSYGRPPATIAAGVNPTVKADAVNTAQVKRVATQAEYARINSPGVGH